MRRIPKVGNDPLRNKDGTLQVHYTHFTAEGVEFSAITRTFRCTPEQFQRFQGLLTEMFDGSPELRPAAEVRS